MLNVASEADFDELRRTRQEVYANLEHADVDDPARVARVLGNYPYDFHAVLDVPPVGGRAIAEPFLERYGALFATLAAKRRGEGRLASLTVLSTQMPAAGREQPGALTATQAAFLRLEDDAVAFGEAHGVRVVVMRVADRVYAPGDSAVRRVADDGAAAARASPCRVEACSDAEPVTRVHSEDLALVLRRMLSMFDLVENRGGDPAMRGTAARGASLARFPSGTVLEVVDDGVADSMVQADAWAAVMMGDDDAAFCVNRTAPTEPRAHRAARGRNAALKRALGMPTLRYPTYHAGGAKMFGAGEF